MSQARQAMLVNLRSDLRNKTNPERAVFSKRFFKTGEGQYGFGDEFLGTSVPDQRKIAKKYIDLGFDDLQKLLDSKVHEERLTALFILVGQFVNAGKMSSRAKRGDLKISSHSFHSVQASTPRNDKAKNIYNFYIKNTKRINSWDLVDASAPYIVGAYLLDKDRSILYKLAKSDNLWEKRIAMVATHKFISNGETKDAFAIADILLDDKHDLIQKAVGWMLRESGKKVSEEKLEEFLIPRYKKMPRTSLRYAIERFDEKKRKKYLQGLV